MNDQVIASLINSLKKEIQDFSDKVKALEQRIDALEKSQVKVFGPLKPRDPQNIFKDAFRVQAEFPND